MFCVWCLCRYWNLKEVLQEKYKLSEKDAQEVSDFLMPMLDFNPQVRVHDTHMQSRPIPTATIG